MFRRRRRTVARLGFPKPVMKFEMFAKSITENAFLSGWGNSSPNMVTFDAMGLGITSDKAFKRVLDYVKLQYNNVIINKIVVRFYNFYGSNYFLAGSMPKEYVTGDAPPGLMLDMPARKFHYIFSADSHPPRDSERVKLGYISKTSLKHTFYPKCKKAVSFDMMTGTFKSMLTSMGSVSKTNDVKFSYAPFFMKPTTADDKHYVESHGVGLEYSVKVFCTASGCNVNYEI